MKIEKISPECSEISMKITHGVTNLMGMVHGGMLYALADVVTGLTARADGRKYVTQSAHINFIRNVSEGTVYAKGILIRRGRSITIVRSEVTDEKGNLLADVTVDMFCPVSYTHLDVYKRQRSRSRKHRLLKSRRRRRMLRLRKQIKSFSTRMIHRMSMSDRYFDK